MTDTTIDTCINRLKQLNDPLLDDWTLSLIRSVLENARQGDTMSQLMGYVAYRKRCAEGRDKEKARRVLAALRNNRWGLRDDVLFLQAQARADRESARLGREARRAFHEQIRDTKRLIPPDKRGRGSGSSGRRRRKDTRTSRAHRPPLS